MKDRRETELMNERAGWRHNIGDLVFRSMNGTASIATGLVIDREVETAHVEARPIAYRSFERYKVVVDDETQWWYLHDLCLPVNQR
ncbi:hypothetical protein OAA09_01455 [bacterium]|nr:hypothetical protein [bacterium]